MLVRLTYHDNESFTAGEVVKQARHNYGETVKVETYPESNLAYDYIYFGIQQLITFDQISLFYDDKELYHQKLIERRAEILFKIEEILDSVIIDNETKVGKE